MTTVKKDDVVLDIKTMLDGAGPAVTRDCCIYRVPFNIRRLNKDAYTPKVVSIGPFHHRHPRLQNMQRHKLIYCKAFLQRAETTLDTLIHYIEEVEPNIRSCYSDAIELNKDELVKLILVDSCFILELFGRFFYNKWSTDDKFLLKPWLATNIRFDLMLLENQLPFFVLDNLFNLSFIGAVNGNSASFIELTFEYFAYFNRSKLPPLIQNTISIRHFTDLIRTFHLQHPPERRAPRNMINGSESNMHHLSATELLEAGVRFKVNTDSECLLDFRFSGRVLEIPQLIVDDETEILFRNMVALEQCHYPFECYIIDYVGIWDLLINTNRDVDLLVRKKVLVNWLGDSDSLANMFNGLMKNIIHVNFDHDYFRLCRDLNAFSADPWHKRKATLRRDYCNTPWKTAASIAGIMILVLTLVQSVCSLLQVLQQ